MSEECGRPNACDDEPCDKHEREQAHAEGEHAFCGSECDSIDERRERYAAAILKADHAKDAGYAELADAAMAVADQELRGRYPSLAAHADELYRENARLRAELKGAYAGADHLRAELTRSQADEVERRIEAGKLRAELERQKTLTDAYKEGAKLASEKFHAEIQMLRNALAALETPKEED